MPNSTADPLIVRAGERNAYIRWNRIANRRYERCAREARREYDEQVRAAKVYVRNMLTNEQWIAMGWPRGDYDWARYINRPRKKQRKKRRRR